MWGNISKTFAFVTFFAVDFIFGFRVIFERANVAYINEKYLESVKLNVRRYSRRGAYYFNAEGRIKHAWTNNVTIHLILYEYLHNEYRRSFIEIRYKACDFLKKEPYVGGMLAAAGITCPCPAGYYRLMNLTASTMDNFPNVWPFEKGRVESTFTITATGETVGVGYLDALFINERKKPKKGN